MKQLSNVIDGLLKPLSKKFGVLETQLKLHWKELLHEPLSLYSRPSKVLYNKYDKSNTLYVLVSNGGIALEIQYVVPVLLEKIAIFFGYKIIQQVKIKQEVRFE